MIVECRPEYNGTVVDSDEDDPRLYFIPILF